MNSTKYKIAVIIFFLMLVVFMRFYLMSNNRWKDYYTSLQYVGTITSKYKDFEHRNQPVIIIDSQFNQKYYIENDSVFDFIRPGDCIIKIAGSTEHYLVRGTDTIDFFPKIGGEYIK